MMRYKYIYILGIGLSMMVACKPGVPREYIQPSDMEDILYDYYVSQGIVTIPSGDKGNEDYKRDLYFNAVLKKHRVTRADFDSSMVYYYTRADRFVGIYRNVQERLSQDALNLGASEGEVERFTTQSLSGDTANVWEGDRFVMLIPYAPYNRMQFIQKADTSYHKGDSFMLTFKSDFLYQGGSKDAMAYLALKYENDSVASQTVHFSVSGNTQLRMNACDLKVKEVMGFFCLGQDDEKNTALRLLFMTDIQLVRFHKQKNDNKMSETKADPSSVNSDSTRIIPDSVRIKQMHKFGVRPEVKQN